MQFLPDKNFAVGFLSAKIDLMEARGVGVCIEEWRGKGNFRVFKKKEKNVTTALPSEANDTATTTDAATKGRRETKRSGNEKTEPRSATSGILMGGFILLLSISNPNANRRCEQENSRCGE